MSARTGGPSPARRDVLRQPTGEFIVFCIAGASNPVWTALLLDGVPWAVYACYLTMAVIFVLALTWTIRVEIRTRP